MAIKKKVINKELEDSDEMIQELIGQDKKPQSVKPKIIKKTIPTKPLTQTPTPKNPSVKKPIPSKGKLDVSQIAKEVRNEMISKQREPVEGILGLKDKRTKTINKFILTGVPGFDDLLKQGIPRGNSIILAGGAGSGKTIFCLQTLAHHAAKGKKCLYVTFEENEDRLCNHMMDFGWKAQEYIKNGTLKILRMSPFDITRNVDAMLAKQKGELLIDIEPMIIPKDFQPDIVAIDSLTAIASAFTGKDDSYRIYIEQLFRFFEEMGSTNFLITETEQVPKIFSPTGVEEFLADGVIVLYSLKHGNVRENAIEVLKLRGAAHQKKIVAMQITGNGVVVYPEQEVFSDTE
jgi:KaiC/GvpD/RAD55 family RecA-like ATPase